MAEVKAVCFDLDDTLLWDERSVAETFKEVCHKAEELTGVPADKLEEAVRREARALYESYETFPFTKLIGINPFEGLWAKFDGGVQPEFRKLQELVPAYRRDSWYNALKSCGIDDKQLAEELGELFATERRSRPYTYDETFVVLNELKGKVKLLLLTNGCPSLQQEKLDGVPDLVSYFDEVIISGSFGRGKPDVTIFEHALRLLGTAPEETVMVGDKLTTDIKGALSAGIPSVWINRDGKTRNEEIIPDYEIAHLFELLELVKVKPAIS